MKFGFIIILLFALSPCFAETNTEAESHEIRMLVSGTIDVDYSALTPQPGQINFTAHVVPMNSRLVSYDCVNCNLTTDENSQKVIQGVFYGVPEKIEWLFTATITTAREINYISSAPSFPYEGSFPDEIKKYLEFTSLSNYDKNICTKATEVASGSENYLEAVLKLGEWVYNTMEYNKDYGNKNHTATAIYSLKKGVCSDYSVLYISMLRCLGMPARYAAGHVYDNLEYGPHAWAEVYVPSHGWISVDPTFGELGWLNPSHVKTELADDASTTKLVAVSYPSYASVETSTETILRTLSTNYEQEELNPELFISSDKIPVNSYFLASVDFPKQNYYIPLSVYLIKTKSMNISYGNPLSYVLLNPVNSTKKYFILKSPDIKLNPLEYVTSNISFLMPFLGQDKIIETFVYPSGTSETFEELKQDILLETTTVSSIKTDYIQTNATYDKNIDLNLSIKNTGNTMLQDIKVTVSVNSAENVSSIDSLLISESKNLSIPIVLSKGNNSVSILINYSNSSYYRGWNLFISEKPAIEFIDLTPSKIKQDENFTGVVIFSNPEKTFFRKIELIVSTPLSTASVSVSDLNNSYNFTLFVKPENFNMGVNTVTYYFTAEDSYGIKTEHLIKKQVEVLPSDIISWLKFILGRIIDFVFNLLN